MLIRNTFVLLSDIFCDLTEMIFVTFISRLSYTRHHCHLEFEVIWSEAPHKVVTLDLEHQGWHLMHKEVVGLKSQGMGDVFFA